MWRSYEEGRANYVDPQRAQSSTDVWVPKDADGNNLRDEGKYVWVAADDGGAYIWIPKDNEKDLADIPDNVKKGLRILPVSTVDEVIAQALVRAPIAIEWIEPAEVEAVAKKPEGEGGLVTH